MFFPIDEEHEKIVDNFVRERNLKEQTRTTEGRFKYRQKLWRHKKQGVLLHYWWWFFHNTIVHPILGVLPVGVMFRLHDWASDKLNRR